MSTEQSIGNFIIIERIQYEHLPFPSREELLDFIYGMDQHIRDENQFGTEYRRKPKTKLVHGVEIPDIGIDLSLTKGRTDFYAPCTHSNRLFIGLSHHSYNDRSNLSALGLTYPYTKEGRQAAILHAKAMLGIDPNE